MDLPDPRTNWLPVLLMILLGVGFAVGNVVASALVGPARTGRVKEQTYESGMTPVGDARRRFNVRFYLVAILFVAFDVEIVVMYPFAAAFGHELRYGVAGGAMLAALAVFLVLVLVGYLYDVGKGVLKFD